MLVASTSVVGFNCTTPVASFSRTPPSRPLVSPRSRASATGPRAVRRRASTATASPFHQPLAAVLAENFIPPLRRAILAADIRLRAMDSFAVCRHRARNAGREGRLRAARLRPGTAGSKPPAHKGRRRDFVTSDVTSSLKTLHSCTTTRACGRQQDCCLGTLI